MNIIFLIILFPLIGFLLLSSVQGNISKRKTDNIGIFTILISFIIVSCYCVIFTQNSDQFFIQRLWNCLSIHNLNFDFTLLLDSLSLSMLFVITGVGLLINIFSSWYMQDKEGYSRFFAYTNLFIASMSVLVLADNFLFMYVGWEGVSVCSYLLINFYYTESYNNSCALKAFILTRVSDIFLMIGIFLIYKEYHTFNFQELKFLSTFLNTENFYNLNILTICLLIGVIAKSAQLPLQTWLSDAMVGPTPVSALIHAATMVTAGVYLISRTYFLFLLTPDVLYFVGFIGVLTIFISSLSALVQTDIKRILAYSTMSQIGYMFLALGVKAWSAAIMHLIMHAIFKALLFLSAGSLILSCQNEKNIFKMGGLWKKLPFLYINFIVGGASLIAFPLVTSGFYSKGNILFNVLQGGYIYFFLIALFCSFLTSLYTFRMIFVIFHGKNNTDIISLSKTWSHNFPLFILLFFSTFFGSYISLPLLHVLPVSHSLTYDNFILEIICSILSVSGIFFSYYFYIKNSYLINNVYKSEVIRKIRCFFFKGWCFDWLYEIFFINFYLYISKQLCCDPANRFFHFFIKIIKNFNYCLLKTSSGYIRLYSFSIMLGINLIFILILLCN